MPGITEQQLHKHSGLRTRQVIIADRGAGQEWYTTGDPHTVTIGTRLEQTAGWKSSGATESGPQAMRSASVRLDCDGTVATRVVKLKLFGEDQFGRSRTEELEIVGTASTDRGVHSVTMFSKVTGAEVLTNTGTVAGDVFEIGHLHTGTYADTFPAYAIPFKLRSSADIIGGWAFEAGAEVGLDLGTHVTFSPHHNSVSLHSSVAPDGGNDRMVVLCIRTNDR